MEGQDVTLAHTRLLDTIRNAILKHYQYLKIPNNTYYSLNELINYLVSKGAENSSDLVQFQKNCKNVYSIFSAGVQLLMKLNESDAIATLTQVLSNDEKKEQNQSQKGKIHPAVVNTPKPESKKRNKKDKKVTIS